MKEIKTTRTIEEVTGYEASDGKFFTDREECKKYENSAKMVLEKMLDDMKVGEINEDALWECGGDEWLYKVFKPNTEHDIEVLNRMIVIACSTYTKPRLISDEYIGKEVMLGYCSYDKCYSGYWTTLDKIIENIMLNYGKALGRDE